MTTLKTIKKQIIKKEIKRVKDLIKGETLTIKVPELKCTFLVTVCWEQESSVTVIGYSVILNKNVPKIFKAVLSSIIDLYPVIECTAAFKKYHKRITIACDIANKLDKKYGNGFWDKYILSKAGK